MVKQILTLVQHPVSLGSTRADSAIYEPACQLCFMPTAKPNADDFPFTPFAANLLPFVFLIPTQREVQAFALECKRLRGTLIDRFASIASLQA